MARAALDTYCRSALPLASEGGADSDELHAAMQHTSDHVGGENHTPGSPVAFDHVAQMRLINRNLACVKQVNFAGVYIQAKEVVTQLGQAGRRYKSDISRAYNGDVHTGVARRFGGSVVSSCGPAFSV